MGRSSSPCWGMAITGQCFGLTLPSVGPGPASMGTSLRHPRGGPRSACRFWKYQLTWELGKRFHRSQFFEFLLFAPTGPNDLFLYPFMLILLFKFSDKWHFVPLPLMAEPGPEVTCLAQSHHSHLSREHLLVLGLRSPRTANKLQEVSLPSSACPLVTQIAGGTQSWNQP